MASSFTTAVPQPFFGPQGVVVPTEDAILTGVQSDLNTALGGNINPSLTNPTGQIATTETAIIGDSNAQFAFFCNQVDPALNSGRMQDAVGRLYFMTRIAAQPTIQPCTCVGLNTTPIPVGALAQDPDTRLLWMCEQAGAIGISGSVTLNFQCTTSGPIAAPVSLVIYQQIFGWESIAPSGAAVLGNNVETAAQFEIRRQNSVAANANQIMDAILGQVLAVPGVLDAYCYDNATNQVATVGGVLLGPNSIYVAVLGGDPAAIAAAIYSKKGPGAGYNGNTFVTVADPNPAYNPPPLYSVGFTAIAGNLLVPFVVLVVIKNSAAVPANALALVQQAIIDAFNGLDGGPRAKIGSLVLASRYYDAVTSLGSWAKYGALISIQLGVLGSGATFTGSIGGVGNDVLTVTAVASGVLAPGQLLQDAGLLAGGTLIVSQLTGTTGLAGTYRVSIAQSISSETMSATTLVDDVQMRIDQAPVVAAGNISLILQ